MIKMRLKDFRDIEDSEKVDIWMKARGLLVKEASKELGISDSTLWTYRTKRYNIPKSIIKLMMLDLKARGNLMENGDESDI